MKHLLFILLLCCCHGYGQDKEDYVIAKIALNEIPEVDQYRLLQQPNNNIISDYLNGFSAADFGQFNNVRFTFVQENIKHWKSGNKYWGENLNKKIEIIGDFNEVQKTRDLQDSKSYIRLSNPAISTDGQYAIINVDFLSDYVLPTPDSYLMIFRKEKDQWKFISKFNSMLY